MISKAPLTDNERRYKLSLPLLKNLREKGCRVPHTPARLFGSIWAITWKTGARLSTLAERAERCGINQRTAERSARTLQTNGLVDVDSWVHRGWFKVCDKAEVATVSHNWFPKNKWLWCHAGQDGLETFNAHLVRQWILFREKVDRAELCDQLAMTRKTLGKALRELEASGKLPDLSAVATRREQFAKLTALMQQRQRDRYGYIDTAPQEVIEAALSRVVDDIQKAYGIKFDAAVERTTVYIDWVFANHDGIGKILQPFVFNWSRFGSSKVMSMLREWQRHGFPKPRKKSNNRDTQNRTKDIDYGESIFDR